MSKFKKLSLLATFLCCLTLSFTASAMSKREFMRDVKVFSVEVKKDCRRQYRLSHIPYNLRNNYCTCAVTRGVKRMLSEIDEVDVSYADSIDELMDEFVDLSDGLNDLEYCSSHLYPYNF